MPKEPKICSVLTLPLTTEKWQEDRLDKKLELCRQVYNSMLGYERKKDRKLLYDRRYQNAKETVKQDYQTNRKKSPECKAALKVLNDLYKEYGFTQFGFTGDVALFYKHFSENISSTMASRSIAMPMWMAFDKLLFGNGQDVHFKKYGDFRSIVTDGKSGIRLINEAGKTLTSGSITEKCYVLIGTRGSKSVMIPVVPSNDWEKEMFCRPIRTIRIIRKKTGSKGRSRYLVQFTVDGEPVIKRDQEGNPVHTISDKKIGIYIDTKTVTIATNEEIHQYDLGLHSSDYDEKRAELQRYMDASRRATNPDNFNEDGTIKKGIVKDGVRHRLTWNYSNSYKTAKNELADLTRKAAETRKLERESLANLILSYGNQVVANDYPFFLAAQRKKEDELKPNGTPASKKKAGKTISENAPSLLMTLIEQKCAKSGGDVQYMRLTDVEHTAGYRQYYAQMFLEYTGEL